VPVARASAPRGSTPASAYPMFRRQPFPPSAVPISSWSTTMFPGGRRPGVGPAHDQPVITGLTTPRSLPSIVVLHHTLQIVVQVHPISRLRRTAVAVQDAPPRPPGVARHRADGERARDARHRPQQLGGRSAGDEQHRVRCPVTRRCRSRHRPRLPCIRHSKSYPDTRSRRGCAVQGTAGDLTS